MPAGATAAYCGAAAALSTAGRAARRIARRTPPDPRERPAGTVDVRRARVAGARRGARARILLSPIFPTALPIERGARFRVCRDVLPAGAGRDARRRGAGSRPSLEDVAHTLGHGSVSVFVRVTLPLLCRGCSRRSRSSSSSVDRVDGHVALASDRGPRRWRREFWAYTSDFSYGAAAPYALTLMLVAMVPGVALGYWFERIGERDRRVTAIASRLEKSLRRQQRAGRLSFTASDGTVTAMLGASGSGKTTLLKTIAGLEHADQERLRSVGEPSTAPGPSSRPSSGGSGTCRRTARCSRTSTSRRTSRSASRARSGAGRGDRVTRAARAGRAVRSGSAACLTSCPEASASGSPLARALAPGSGIVLLDEPFSSLDAELRVSMRPRSSTCCGARRQRRCS